MTTQELELVEAQPEAGGDPAKRHSIPLTGLAPGREILFRDSDGTISLSRTDDVASGATLLALLRLLPGATSAKPLAVLLPRSADLLVNGIRPVRLRVLEPGDLITAGDRDYLLAVRYRPRAQPAPADLPEDAACPVCGLPLKLQEIPLCQCSCGAWFHLYNPEGDPGSPEELNCFLFSAPCISCGRIRSLEERWIPDPAEVLR